MRRSRRTRKFHLRIKNKKVGIPRPRFGRDGAHTFATGGSCTVSSVLFRFVVAPIVAMSTAADSCLGQSCSAASIPPHLSRPRRQNVQADGLQRRITSDDAFTFIPFMRGSHYMAPALELMLTRWYPSWLCSDLCCACDFAKNGSATFHHNIQVAWRAPHDIRIGAHQLHMAATSTSSNHYRGLADESSDDHAFEEAL